MTGVGLVEELHILILAPWTFVLLENLKDELLEACTVRRCNTVIDLRSKIHAD